MTTAKKLDTTFPVLKSIQHSGYSTVQKIHPLLRESRDIFEQMGWGALPDDLKLTIAIDLVGFRDELSGLYSTKDPNVLARRKSIYYWVNQYLNGICSEITAIQSLRIMSLA
ncbi:MAG TPA: hypothetical protein DCE78_06490 [Bacteroidetes bacterium]|nr:hypothetical protein [Bacteroidota bacterium]